MGLSGIRGTIVNSNWLSGGMKMLLIGVKEDNGRLVFRENRGKNSYLTGQEIMVLVR